MKQVLQYRRSGRTRVVEVPAPAAPAGGVLVHNRWSLISPGTERMLVEAGGANLLNTARQRPDLVKQVVDKARREGVGATIQAVRSRLDVAIPLGYSTAGVVVDLAPELAADGYAVGDRVACAGAGLANHAEFVGVPRNLTARIPDGVAFEDAAFVTVGAIALQGVRIADVRVGETCVVIGLGLVGQLTVQILKAAGCRVFGIDIAPDKVALALTLGADGACLRSDPTLDAQVRALTGGRGADAVLITAATASSDPVQVAATLARDRAVVVAVGLVGTDVPRNAYYEKELELRLSRSYGPGRYDQTYEQQGIDYPIGYVRWTEQRNMEAFLQLVAEGKVRPAPLVTHRFTIEDAERAYAVVTGEAGEPYLGILLQYSAGSEPTRQVMLHSGEIAAPRSGLGRSPVQLGVVGAGNFAKSVLLPRFREQGARVAPRGLATASGPSAQQTGERFGFARVSTDWRAVVGDPHTDAVVVATRHDLHATVAEEALRAGKHVFLEKPMALDADGVASVLNAWRSSGKVLMVGFNRRFAPTTERVRAAFADRTGPLTMHYRVNAGSVAADSWVLDPAQGGGRLLGEVCHMVDLLSYLASAPVSRVYAQALPKPPTRSADDVAITLTFADGSLGTIVYAAGGDRAMPKERIEVMGGGRSAVLDDFSSVRIYQAGQETRGGGMSGRSQDKGHAAEVKAFVDAVLAGGPSPVDPEQAAHVTLVTLAALESARSGLPVEMHPETWPADRRNGAASAPRAVSADPSP